MTTPAATTAHAADHLNPVIYFESAEERELVVTELRAAAAGILSTAVDDAASLVATQRESGGDCRTRALHLAQRLAHAADVNRLADKIERTS